MGVFRMMEQVDSQVSSANVIPLTEKQNQTLTLQEVLKQAPEFRGFLRFVKRYDLRIQALALVEKKLSRLH